MNRKNDRDGCNTSGLERITAQEGVFQTKVPDSGNRTFLAAKAAMEFCRKQGYQVAVGCR